MSAVTPVLEARALCIGHARREVARDVSFTLKAGRVLALLGPNGAGKTTLFKTLLGLIPARGGEVRVLGRPLAAWSRQALASRIGYVPQAHAGLFPFTVEDIVLMGRAMHIGRFSAPSPRDRAIAARCIEMLGISALARRVHTQISGGERQLALIARALAQEPSLLVMDEPTASLDFGNQIRVLEQIARLRDEGIAILLSTHQPEHALRCADDIALLAAGGILASGSAARVASVENLARLYAVPEQAIRASLPQVMPESSS